MKLYRDSVARAHHTVTLFDGDLYIIGGLVSLRPARLAGNEVHILRYSNVGGLGPDYKAVPALSESDELDPPQARAGHSATLINGKIYVFGGHAGGDHVESLNEIGRVWAFDPKTLRWSAVDPINSEHPQLHSHTAVIHGDHIIFHGGFSGKSTSPTTDTWRFGVTSRIWTQLPSLNSLPASSPMAAVAPPNFACVGDKLYLITSASSLEGQIHILDLSEGSSPETSTWKTTSFPTNPLTPGPRPRHGAGILSITTTPGRNYLLLAFGATTTASEDPSSSSENARSSTTEKHSASDVPFWSDMWSLQLPASLPFPSAVKDAIRSQLGMSTGETKWSEVDILAPEDKDLPTEDGASGKIHPGPRGYFAYDRINNKSFVIWGGEDALGNCIGDGWVIHLTT